jgi:hypothetical protein
MVINVHAWLKTARACFTSIQCVRRGAQNYLTSSIIIIYLMLLYIDMFRKITCIVCHPGSMKRLNWVEQLCCIQCYS